MKKIKSELDKSLFELGREFKKSEKSILNEFDAQATLFNILRKNIKKAKELIHCQCKVDGEDIRPDLMVFEKDNFEIEKFKSNKKDEYSIKKWRGNIYSVIEIKHLLEANSEKVFKKIKSDFRKLDNAGMDNSYVILLHHSSKIDKNLIEKIKEYSKKNKKIFIFYCNRKIYCLVKNGEIEKQK